MAISGTTKWFCILIQPHVEKASSKCIYVFNQEQLRSRLFWISLKIAKNSYEVQLIFLDLLMLGKLKQTKQKNTQTNKQTNKTQKTPPNNFQSRNKKKLQNMKIKLVAGSTSFFICLGPFLSESPRIPDSNVLKIM